MTPDDRHFIMLQRVTDSTQQEHGQLVVIENWTALLSAGPKK